MSKGFLCSSISQGSYLICDKQRRNSTRSSFRDVSWLTMIGFFGINHHDFLQLKESLYLKWIQKWWENTPSYSLSLKLVFRFVNIQNLMPSLTWKYMSDLCGWGYRWVSALVKCGVSVMWMISVYYLCIPTVITINRVRGHDSMIQLFFHCWEN